MMTPEKKKRLRELRKQLFSKLNTNIVPRIRRDSVVEAGFESEKSVNLYTPK